MLRHRKPMLFISENDGFDLFQVNIVVWVASMWTWVTVFEVGFKYNTDQFRMFTETTTASADDVVNSCLRLLQVIYIR